MRTRPLHAAAGLLLVAFAAGAAAAPTYTVSNCAQPSPTPMATPQSISDTCSSTIGFAETRARADAGSVGAYARTKQTAGNSASAEGSAFASFYTDEIVVSTLPSAGTLPDLVYMALRFQIDGILDVPSLGQARAQVVGALGTIAGNASFHNGRDPQIFAYTVIEDESDGDVVKMVLETGRILVEVGQALDARLSVGVSTLVAEGNEATSNFIGTVSFATGRDVFAFYDASGNPVNGYTVNAGDYIVGNRFGATARAVSEPATLALFGLGFAGLAVTRRRGRPAG
jgi:hypothetical protein